MGAPAGRRVGGGEAQAALKDPPVLPLRTAPRRGTVPTRTPPENLGTSRTLPRRNSQPAAQLVCLIRPNLTSSAKPSPINPITSNHSIWHMLFLFLEVHTWSHCLE